MFYVCSLFPHCGFLEHNENTPPIDCINAIDNHSQLTALAMCGVHSLILSHAFDTYLNKL